MLGKSIPYFVPLKFGANNVARTDKLKCTIMPFYVGKVIEVYNGKSYIPLNITAQMVNFKLGDFIPTKKFGPKPKKDKAQAVQKGKKK